MRTCVPKLARATINRASTMIAIPISYQVFAIVVNSLCCSKPFNSRQKIFASECVLQGDPRCDLSSFLVHR